MLQLHNSHRRRGSHPPMAPPDSCVNRDDKLAIMALYLIGARGARWVGRGKAEERAAPDMDQQKTGERGAARDRSGRFRKGCSGNPAGRPRGSVNRATRATLMVSRQSADGWFQDRRGQLTRLPKFRIFLCRPLSHWRPSCRRSACAGTGGANRPFRVTPRVISVRRSSGRRIRPGRSGFDTGY